MFSFNSLIKGSPLTALTDKNKGPSPINSLEDIILKILYYLLYIINYLLKFTDLAKPDKPTGPAGLWIDTGYLICLLSVLMYGLYDCMYTAECLAY